MVFDTNKTKKHVFNVIKERDYVRHCSLLCVIHCVRVSSKKKNWTSFPCACYSRYHNHNISSISLLLLVVVLLMMLSAASCTFKIFTLTSMSKIIGNNFHFRSSMFFPCRCCSSHHDLHRLIHMFLLSLLWSCVCARASYQNEIQEQSNQNHPLPTTSMRLKDNLHIHLCAHKI